MRLHPFLTTLLLASFSLPAHTQALADGGGLQAELKAEAPPAHPPATPCGGCLTEDYREVIVQVRLVGLTRAENAEQLGRPEGAGS